MSHPSPPDVLPAFPILDRFEDVADTARYHPLPDDWWLALADVVGSTEAIRRGEYKAVNMTGAAVISAVSNATGIPGLPFVFGGDGAFVALPGQAVEPARSALAAMRRWATEEMKLELRTALVPIAAIRSAGHDVRVARFRASEFVTYAMFAGGGASWAEAEMKQNRFAVAAAPPGTHPDLTGLSCRWAPVDPRNGEIVSIIALPTPSASPETFSKLVADLASLSSEEERDGNPIPPAGPPLAINRWGVGAEARLGSGPVGRLKKRIGIWIALFLVVVLHVFKGRLGAFDARRYTMDIAANADFRKFDDGLKMTIDVTPEGRERIEARLRKAEAEGVCRYALLRQDSALMTCIVPTPLARDHMHFVDGGSGGYAAAASKLKAQIKVSPT